jgi:hypothetical protein
MTLVRVSPSGPFLDLGGGGGAGGGALVYSPGNPAPDPAAGIFDTWAAVVAALSADGATVAIDTTHQNPAPVPAGVWAMRQARLQAYRLDAIQNTDLRCLDGAVLHDVREVKETLVLSSESTAAVLTFEPGTAPLLILSRGGSLRAEVGAAPLIDHQGPGQLTLAAIEGAEVGDGITPVASVAVGATLFAVALAAARYSPNWAVGPVGATLGYQHDDTSAAPSTPGFLGAVVNQRASDGAETLFTPSNPQLADPPPDTVQGALDELRHTNSRRVEIVEDWINLLTTGDNGWAISTASGGNVIVGSLTEPEHPGVCQPTVGTLAASRGCVSLGILASTAGAGGGTFMPRLLGGTRTQEWVARLLNVEAVPTYRIAVGLQDSFGNPGNAAVANNAIAFGWGSAPFFPNLNWHAMVGRAAVGVTRVDTGIPANVLAWRNLRIHETPAGADFYIGDTLVATIPITDPNYPLQVGAALMGFGVRAVATGVALTSRGFIVDYCRLRWTFDAAARS